METGQVPANMKIAKIIPIYKSKEKTTTWEIIDQYPSTINLENLGKSS